MARPESWSEIAYVTITELNGVDRDFCAMTETIDIDEGERPIETTHTMCGGKIVRTLPQEDTTVTMTVYPVQAGTVTGSTGYGFYDLFYDSVTTATGSVSVDNSRGTRKRYRIAVLWTDDNTSNSGVRAVSSPTYAAKRWTGRNGYITKITPSFEAGAGQLSYDVTFMIPARQADGSTANIQIESVDGVGSATMAALSSYTTTTDGF